MMNIGVLIGKQNIYPIPGLDPKWEAIQEHCRKMSAEMLVYQMEEFAEWGNKSAK